MLIIRRLVTVGLGLVGLQAISAGFFLSGYGYAVPAHRAGAMALLAVTLIQAVTAVVLRVRGRVPRWVVGLSVGLFVGMFVQTGLGFRQIFWLHVPVGVGMFAGLTRQLNRLERGDNVGADVQSASL
jgi:hypothetical protein